MDTQVQKYIQEWLEQRPEAWQSAVIRLKTSEKRCRQPWDPIPQDTLLSVAGNPRWDVPTRIAHAVLFIERAAEGDWSTLARVGRSGAMPCIKKLAARATQMLEQERNRAHAGITELQGIRRAFARAGREPPSSRTIRFRVA